jgi:DNA-binding HxlR family transcriptional regulator
MSDEGCTVELENVRNVLSAIADKWTLIVLEELGERTLRFGELQRAAGRVSQKVLTQTLRDMERDGFVTRTVHPEVPPRVEYTLTPMGHDLSYAICGIWKWTSGNYGRVLQARAAFDAARTQRVTA